MFLKGNLMKYFSKVSYVFIQKLLQRLSERLYVPTQTGSHDVGTQFLGNLASSYVEHQNFPNIVKSSFRGIKILRG
jgi:hypothetical protein